MVDMGMLYINLNRESINYVNTISATLSCRYNYIRTDYMHLNPYGILLFGNMVSLLIDGSLGQAREWTTPNVTIAAESRMECTFFRR